jgi:hypothetical protein
MGQQASVMLKRSEFPVRTAAAEPGLRFLTIRDLHQRGGVDLMAPTRAGLI